MAGNHNKAHNALIQSILEFLSWKGIFAWPNSAAAVYDPKRRSFRKNHSKYHMTGVADILGCLSDGRLLAIEVKTGVGRPTPEQKRFIEAVNNRNGIAFVARDVEIVEKLLALYV